LGKVPVKGWLDLHLTIAASHSALIINDVANATIDGNPGFALARNNEKRPPLNLPHFVFCLNKKRTRIKIK